MKVVWHQGVRVDLYVVPSDHETNEEEEDVVVERFSKCRGPIVSALCNVKCHASHEGTFPASHAELRSQVRRRALYGRNIECPRSYRANRALRRRGQQCKNCNLESTRHQTLTREQPIT